MDIGDICRPFVVIAALLGHFGQSGIAGIQFQLVFVKQVAGDISRILSLAAERPAVQSAGGYLRLPDLPLFIKEDRLGAALTAEPGGVGLAVVENVPLAVDFHDAAVVVPADGRRAVGGLVGADSRVHVAYDRAAIRKGAAGILRCGVAQFMHQLRGIHEVISVSPLADGGRLEKRVALKPGALVIHIAGRDKDGFFFDGQHIRPQHGAHRSVAGLIPMPGKAGIQIGFVTLGQHAGIKLRLVAGPLAQAHTVFVLHIPQEFETSRRGIAHGHGHEAHLVIHVIQIVASIGALCHVGRVEAHAAICVAGVRVAGINHALTPPVGKVVYRGGPAHIIAHAENTAVEKVVGTVHVHPAAEHVGLAVRNIFPGGKIGIERLFPHESIPSFPNPSDRHFVLLFSHIHPRKSSFIHVKAE